MSIYSTNLGIGTFTTTATLLYTVPASAGPAIVKQINMNVAAGRVAGIWAKNPAVSGTCYLVYEDNSAGSSLYVVNVATWCVLEPGWELYGIEVSGGGSIPYIISGYQFAQP